MNPQPYLYRMALLPEPFVGSAGVAWFTGVSENRA